MLCGNAFTMGVYVAPECSRDEQNSAGEGGIRPSQEDASEEEKEGEKVLSISKLALDMGADS